MNGQMMSYKEKQRIVDEFIEKNVSMNLNLRSSLIFVDMPNI